MISKAICALAFLFCLFLTGCETKDVTPSWWHEAQLESFSLDGQPPLVVIVKKPLARLMGLSIFWSWVFFGWLSSKDPDVKGHVFYSPLQVWLGICLARLALRLLFYMITYIITGTAYVTDFSFLFLNVLGFAITLSAIVLVVELTSNLFFSIKNNWQPVDLRIPKINSVTNIINNSFVNIFLLFLTIWSYIFTFRDLIGLILHLFWQ